MGIDSKGKYPHSVPDTENNLSGHFKVSVSELDKTLSILRPQTLGLCGTCAARVTTRASERLLLWTESFLCEGEGVDSLLEHEIIFRI